MYRGRMTRVRPGQPVSVGTGAGSLTSRPGRMSSGRATRGQDKIIPEDVHVSQETPSSFGKLAIEGNRWV